MHRQVINHQKPQLKAEMSSRYEQQGKPVLKPWSGSISNVTAYMSASPRTALNPSDSGKAQTEPDQLMVSMLLQYCSQYRIYSAEKYKCEQLTGFSIFTSFHFCCFFLFVLISVS